MRANLVRAGRVEEELLAAHAHADAGVAENDGARDPAAARRGVEDVAVLVDDGDVRRVLADAGGVEPARGLHIRGGDRRGAVGASRP